MSLLASHLFALSQKYNFRYYGTEEGLPQQSVLSILSDESGVLHVGTQGGFCRFDGRDFNNLSQKNGLNSNHVTSIYQDLEGNFWLGHRYDAPTFVSEDTIIGLSGSWSDSIRSSTWGITRCLDKMWFVTEKEGLFSYDIESKKVRPFKDDKLRGVTITTLQTVGKRLLIGTSNGLFYKEGQLLGQFSNRKIDNLKVLSVKQDNANEDVLYILTTEKLLKAIISENKLTSIETIYSRNKTNLSSWKDFVVKNDNEFWVNSVEGALQIKNGESTLYTTQNGLGVDHVASMAIDREGNVWFGLFGAGLYQMLGEDFLQIDESIGLVDNKVTGISSYNNEVWITTDEGLSRIHYSSNSKIEIKRIDNYTSENVLLDNKVYSNPLCI